MSNIKKIDFMVIVDVRNGNPNGDPDNGNMPRMDANTGKGWITDVAFKRRLRDYLLIRYPNLEGYEIYVQQGVHLNTQHKRAYDKLGISAEPPEKQKRTNPNKLQLEEIQKILCETFFDIRTFGAVMGTKVNAGHVKGPVQINMGESVDPIFPEDLRITRVAKTREDDDGDTEFGDKNIVPYGLYVFTGHISPLLAEKTGFSEDDLEVLWKAIEWMYEFDRSSSKGLMTTQKLYVFEHDSVYGNAHADKLFDLVNIESKVDNPRSFSDYEITVGEEPDGVKIIEKI